MCQQKMSDGASLQEEKACPDCPMTKNRPEMGLERLVELSTISYGCTKIRYSHGIWWIIQSALVNSFRAHFPLIRLSR